MSSGPYLGLDVGEKRIGVALADDAVRIAVPYDTIVVDGGERQAIEELIISHAIKTVIVGYPRNQSGDPTAQTAYVERFTAQIDLGGAELVFQDESLTSVAAEERLKSQNRPYRKGEIDAMAAAIIVQDYLESHRA
ncbi:MAG: putative Holliday junction resolvase [Candidatus Saccharibacteria bacterium]|nr:putative Holliday junction resolvase [Candidatus Saccharibacteria bacterium]